MTNRELYQLAYRAAAAFELEPDLWCRGATVAPFPRSAAGRRYCAIGAMAGIARAIPRGVSCCDARLSAGSWIRAQLTSVAWHNIIAANDLATDAHDAAQRIRAAADRLWGGK